MQMREIYYQTKGNGPNVILFHGLAASHHDWVWIMPELVANGFHVFTPDLPGHGKSSGPQNPNEYTIDYIFSQIIQWIETVEIKKPIILIGHSLGAYLSILLANHFRNNISKLVLVSPFFNPKQIYFLARKAMKHPIISEQALRFANVKLVDSILALSEPITGKYPPNSRWQTAVDYTYTKPASMRFLATSKDLTPILKNIFCPTLVIWSEQDFILRPKLNATLLKSIRNAQGVPLKGYGHEPHLTQTEIFNKLVLNFLSGISHEC